MTGDAAKFLALTLVLAACLLTAQAGPCHSRPGEPAPVIVLAAGPGKYVIKAGDTINVLALRHGVPAAAILRANPGLNPARLPLGKEIIIPAATKAGSEASAPAVPAAVPTPAVAAAPAVASGGQGIELRPGKVPQATPLPGSGIKSHDLPDAVAKPTAPAGGKEAGPTDAPQVAETVVATPQRQAPRSTDTTVPGPAAPAGNWSMGAVWVLAGVVGGALIVALALQGVFANVVAGVMLRLLRPFRPGDAVLLAGIVGRVETIGGCYVAIRSEAGETVLVPNAKAAGEIVVVAKAKTKAAVKDTGKRADRS
ncbi:mechanosensitive ion channel [Desulfovibrio aerotolerans]|uniref:Mechanosensitive ion channel n=1 Tax=Solidesulfovibrio aerotolerans TaxID=295255 RepID=A0A7C9MMT1_9BACT|nr:mechanosensitive ion channel domain-containing protein [Solidesulfovibrio aerotolerans]MYL82072.1 mechanosensitive ion channel [Solidesulfovibrio aerotolerans]